MYELMWMFVFCFGLMFVDLVWCSLFWMLGYLDTCLWKTSLNWMIMFEFLLFEYCWYDWFYFSGGFLNFQRKLCPNFQLFIMYMFRGSFLSFIESLLESLIGCFVIIKKGKIVEPLLILMIPKHSCYVY